MLKNELMLRLRKHLRNKDGFIAECGRFVACVSLFADEDADGDLVFDQVRWELYERNLEGEFILKSSTITQRKHEDIKVLWKPTELRLLKLNELPWD